MQEIIRYLEQLGYNKKEATIYITLYTMWSSPASSIARQSTFERVYTYKVLQSMVNDWIIAHTKKSGTTHFRIPNERLLLSFAQKNRQHREKIEDRYEYVQTQFQELRADQQTSAPKIHLFEWKQQIKNLFDDMQTAIIQEQVLSIAVFGTHTFQEQITSHETVSSISEELNKFLIEKKITITNYIAEWWLVMEHIRQYPWIEKLWDLPAWDNAINIFIIWKIVYVVIYKWTPVWLKINSPELAWALHFVLRQTKS